MDLCEPMKIDAHLFQVRPNFPPTAPRSLPLPPPRVPTRLSSCIVSLLPCAEALWRLSLEPMKVKFEACGLITKKGQAGSPNARRMLDRKFFL